MSSLTTFKPVLNENEKYKTNVQRLKFLILNRSTHSGVRFILFEYTNVTVNGVLKFI